MVKKIKAQSKSEEKQVKEGAQLQKRNRKRDTGKVATVGMADGAGRQDSGSWDKLEQVVEKRVVRALSSIGIPTQKDIQALTARIEQLHQAINKLTLAPKTAARPAAAKPAAKPKAAPKARVYFPSAESVSTAAPATARNAGVRKPAVRKPTTTVAPSGDQDASPPV